MLSLALSIWKRSFIRAVAPPSGGFELREDGSFELREDGTFELRE